MKKRNLRLLKKNEHIQKTIAKKQLSWLTRPGNMVAYSIQALGPQGPGYRLAGLPVSCRQLEANAGSVDSTFNKRSK